MRRALLAFAVSMLPTALVGCAAPSFSVPSDQDRRLARHYVLAHEDGYPMRPSREALTLDEYLARLDGILSGIDDHAAELWRGAPDDAPKPPLRILLFVHGGLNGPRDEFDRMRRLLLEADPEDPRRPARSLFARTTYYPIFVNWNASLRDSIADDLVFIRFGERVRGLNLALGVVTAPFVFVARVAESVVRLPTAWWANVNNFSDMDPGPADYAESTILFPVRGLTTAVLKAFGTSAWEIMKRRADLLAAERIRQSPTGTNKGTAPALLEQLAGRVTRDPGLCKRPPGSSDPLACWHVRTGRAAGTYGPLEVTFVGHSMGALVVNRLLASRHELPVKRVVHLAAASSIDEVELLVVPYLRSHPHTTFSAFALNRRDEARERDPSKVLMPRGTLLVWIDNLFEPVSTPAGARFGRFRAYSQYYWESPPSELPVHEFSDASARSPRHHEDFDDLPYFGRILCSVDPGAFLDGSCDGALD